MDLSGVQKKAAPKAGKKVQARMAKADSEEKRGQQTPQPLREDPHVRQVLEAFRLRVG